VNCYIELKSNTLPLNIENVVFNELNYTFYFKQDRDAVLYFDFILVLAMILKEVTVAQSESTQWIH